jgi:hypothetical protein
MESLFFASSVVGVLMVIYWAITNDKAGNLGETTGFFAMRGHTESEADTPAKVQAPKRRR